MLLIKIFVQKYKIIVNCELRFVIYLVSLQQILIKSNILKTIIRILLLFLLVQNAVAQTPKHEIRAVWLTTIKSLDWPHSKSAYSQKQELTQILDQLKRANINTVEDLISKTEDEMMKVRNLGRKSLEEVINKLAMMGLSLASENNN